MAVEFLKPDGLILLRIAGKFGEQGIAVCPGPGPVAFGDQGFFEFFILLVRQFDAVLDLVEIKAALTVVITAEGIHLGAVRRHDQQDGRPPDSEQGRGLADIILHPLALFGVRLAFKFFRLVIADADDIFLGPFLELPRVEQVRSQFPAGGASLGMVEPDQDGIAGSLGLPEGGRITLYPPLVFLLPREGFIQAGNGCV